MADEIDYKPGVDPDSIALGPDSVPLDLRRLERLDSETAESVVGDGANAPTAAESTGGFSLGKLIAAALAFALLGFGLGLMVKDRTDRPGTVDIGFARDMIDHHDQAVQMALLAIAKPDVSPIVRKFATEVIIFQRWELGILDSYLAGWNTARGELERNAMEWMGMSTPVAQMPGMQSEAAMDRLAAAKGVDADRLFLTMMREHHAGGVHMAEYAAEHASEKRVRSLAATMARNQTAEIREYSVEIAELGSSATAPDASGSGPVTGKPADTVPAVAQPGDTMPGDAGGSGHDSVHDAHS